MKDIGELKLAYILHRVRLSFCEQQQAVYPVTKHEPLYFGCHRCQLETTRMLQVPDRFPSLFSITVSCSQKTHQRHCPMAQLHLEATCESVNSAAIFSSVDKTMIKDKYDNVMMNCFEFLQNENDIKNHHK